MRFCFLTSFSTSLAVILGTPSYSQDISAIEDKYTQVYEENRDILEDGQNTGGTKCAVGGTFDAEWGLTSMSFDIPEVTFKMQEMKFHFLKTYSNLRTFSFDVPEVIWGTTSIGPVKLDLPKIYSKRIEIKTHIPEFVWDITTIKTKIPEFTSRRVEWKFHILKIGKLKEVHAECEQYRDEYDTFEASASNIESAADDFSAEANDAALTSLVSATDEISEVLSTSEHEYQSAIQALEDSMIEMIELGADLSKVTTVIDGVEVPITDAKAVITARHNELIQSLNAEQAKIITVMEQVSSQ